LTDDRDPNATGEVTSYRAIKPVFGSWICKSVDADGDVSFWTGFYNVVNKAKTGQFVGGAGSYTKAGTSKSKVKKALRSPVNIAIFNK
tara:strand:- start:174 stop:437 length:264 start_codon:yes stop_codon:yes gene_type:complete